MAQQYKKSFEPHLIPELLLAPLSIKKPSRILVDFTGDLFGDWVDPHKIINGWTAQGFGCLGTATLNEVIHTVLGMSTQHQFFFLTKAPQNISKWGKWPDNAWVGASACNMTSAYRAGEILSKVKAKHHWLSLEPLYEHIDTAWLAEHLIEWVVIGAQSGRHPVQPKIEWVKEIVEACDKAGIKVWLKDNLYPLFKIPEYPNGYKVTQWASEKNGINLIRQELPL
jgi:protein gp37